MNCTKMKKLFRKGTLSILLLGVITFFTYPLSAQTNSRSGKGLYEIFSTKIPDGAQWKAQDNKFASEVWGALAAWSWLREQKQG